MFLGNSEQGTYTRKIHPSVNSGGTKAMLNERRIPENPKRDTFSYPQQAKVFLQFLSGEDFEMYNPL